jgi:DNA-directed RNA polymerase subunit RPC12/RpoP
MSYKCLNCNHIFEEGEEKVYTECMGECHGSPAYDTFRVCPVCGGDFEKTKSCLICGAEYLEDELNGGSVCDECLEGYRRDLKTCYSVAEAEKEEISINSLLVALLDVDEIEEILYRELESMGVNIDCLPYIDQDRDWFAENLIEEVNK